MQSFADTLGQVFKAIAANKLRSFLTMFGIAWGVGSLLVLVGLGEGFRSGQRRNLARFGNDVVMMFNGTIPAVANQHTGMRPYQLTMRDLADSASSPMSAPPPSSSTLRPLRSQPVGQYLQPRHGRRAQLRRGPLCSHRGRPLIDDNDIADRRRVAVLGSKTANLLFPGHPRLGETITINGTAFTVVGLVDKMAAATTTTTTARSISPCRPCCSCFRLKEKTFLTTR